jgi:hypothetical protein
MRDVLLISNVGRKAAVLLAGLGVLAVPIAVAAPAGASVTVTSHFVYTASSTNTSGDSSFIVNGATNSQPGDLLFVSPNWDANDLCDCINETAPIGVWYDASNSEWAAFTENASTMPANEAYNVLVVPANKVGNTAFVQTATSENTAGDFTLINNSGTNNNPSAKIQVTQDWNPGGSGSTYNPHDIGVWYDTSAKEWGIFNEDLASMTVGAAFNVLIGTVPSNGAKSQLVTASSSNTSGDSLFFTNAQTTGNPNNVTFATQVWNPGGKGGTYNDVQAGVWYDGAQEAVFDEDGSTLPLKSAYNLLVFSS